MKRNVLDRFLGFFSPELEEKRIKSRIKSNMLLRSYDAAKTFTSDDWSSATSGSANSEIDGAQRILRDKGSDAVRNNTYGYRALLAITNNVVGTGIMPHIKGKTSLQTRKLNEAWKMWAETTLCDSTRKNNFYAMQTLIMKSVVERGEALVLKEFSEDGQSLRILESDFIATTQNVLTGVKINNQNIYQGIELDSKGRVISYYLYETHPGEKIADYKIRQMSADKVCHIYREDRPGQRRGISWFAPVLRQLEDLNQYQQATLISRKIGACFAAFITTTDDTTLSSADLLAKRETESMMSPGSIRYLNQGEGIQIASPPKIDGYTEYCNQMLRSIASGLGISYESLTSDYSQVNYSSGRMGNLEFRKNVEQWQWSMLIPSFCEPAFKHFLEYAQIGLGIQTEGIQVDWVTPSWSMLDPGKEIDAMKNGMRSGLITYPKAVRELGYQPEDMLQEIADHNKRLDELKIILDCDPRKTTVAGLFQIDPTQNSQNGDINAKQDNQKVPTDGSTTKSN